MSLRVFTVKYMSTQVFLLFSCGLTSLGHVKMLPPNLLDFYRT